MKTIKNIFQYLSFFFVFSSAKDRYQSVGHPSEEEGFVQEKAAGCLGMTGFFIAFIIGMLVFTCSCGVLSPSAAYEPVVTRDKGVVVSKGEQWVEVSYEAVNRKKDTLVRNIYHKPCGHQYEITDKYPDPDKDYPCDL